MTRPTSKTTRFDVGVGMSLVPSTGGSLPWRWAENVVFVDGRAVKRPGRRHLFLAGAGYPIVALIPYRESKGPSYLVVVQRTNGNQLRFTLWSGQNQIGSARTTLISSGYIPPTARPSITRLGADLLIAGHTGGIRRLRIRGGEFSLWFLNPIDRDIEENEIAGQDAGPWRTEPPRVTLACTHQFRTFFSDGANLYWCSPDDVKGLPVNNWQAVGEGQRHTALASFAQRLVVFTRGSLWEMFGGFTSYADTTLRLVSGSVGCVAPGSIQNCAGMLVWQGEQGLVAWDGGGQPRPFAEGLAPLLASHGQWGDLGTHVETFRAGPSRRALTESAWIPERGLYVLTQYHADGYAMVRHLAVEAATGRLMAWSGMESTCHAMWETGRATEALWVSGDSSGAVYVNGIGCRDEAFIPRLYSDYSAKFIGQMEGLGDDADHQFREVGLALEDLAYGSESESDPATLKVAVDGRTSGPGVTTQSLPAVSTAEGAFLGAGSTSRFLVGDDCAGAHLVTRRRGLTGTSVGSSAVVTIDSGDVPEFVIAGLTVDHHPRRRRHAR